MLAALAVGCEGATADPGLSARLRVEGAQFVEGPLEPGNDGPKVTSVENTRNVIRPGERNKPLKGTIEPNATGVGIGLTGDRGYWVVAAGVPDVTTPSLLTFDVRLSFSADIAGDEALTIAVAAADRDGRRGPLAEVGLRAADTTAPEGTLVFSLRWDTEADLDLHVIDPAGIEIWARNINSYQGPPPGQPIDPVAVEAGGVLDVDSNAECVIDGRRAENVVYRKSAPSGHYRVLVDTFSLCKETSARWSVEAHRGTAVVARATGVSVESDTRDVHQAGSGVLALEIDQP